MIVLTILKWIGIVLLWILLGLIALALLILLVVLFVPFRYKISVATRDGTGARAGYGFHLTWILHAVSIKKVLGNDQIVVRILGIPIKRMGTAGISPGGTAAEEDGYDDLDEELWDDEDFDDEYQPAETEEEIEYEPLSFEEEKSISEDESIDNNEIVQFEDKSEEENSNYEYSDRKKEDKITLEDKIKGVKQKINGKYKKFRFIFYKIHSIINFVRSRATKKTIKLLLSETVKAIRYVGPKRIEGYLEFGTGEPEYTGIIMAGVSLIKPVYNKNVTIVPNFNELCLVGNATMWGRIRVVYFLRMAIRVWFNKDFRDLRKQYHQMKKDQKTFLQEDV